MKIEANGDLGTGNSFTEVIIENVATIHIDKQIIVSGSRQCGQSRATEHHREPRPADKEVLRQQILSYAYKTLPFVLCHWQGRYRELWEDILSLPAVDAVIYETGRQENTVFNRKEVCHIIHHIGSDARNCLGIFETYNASRIAMAIDERASKSIRPELGFNPSASIVDAIRGLMASDKYRKIIDKMNHG